MATLVDSNHYNQLPSLGEADLRFQKFAPTGLMSDLREVFLKHDVHDTLCAYKQHRHHKLRANEAIVKVEGTGHRMDEEAIKNIISHGNQVHTTTWMADVDGVQPMEYAVVPEGSPVPTLDPEFVSDFLKVLSKHNASSLLGIDTVFKWDWSEMGVGDASVVVPSNGHDGEQYIPVAFKFDHTEPGFKVHGKCTSNHKHTSKPK